MEHWLLEHPERGRLEAWIGRADELRTVDPGFTPDAPDPGDDGGDGASDGGNAAVDTDASTPAHAEPLTDATADVTPDARGAVSAEVDEPSTGASVVTSADAARALGSARSRAGERLPLSPERKEKLRTHLGLDEEWARPGLVLMRDGVVFARRRSIGNVRIRLMRSTPDGHFTEHTEATEKPRVEVLVNPLRGYVTDVQLRDDDGVTVFEAPADSPAARRYAAMDSSPVKRVLYPLLGGLGKSGWALGVLVLGPLIGRLLGWILGPIIAWIASHMPHVDWPDIPRPHLHLPRIPWPSIDLPNIPWPHLPSWTPPGWLAWLLEHPKVWVPIVIAAFWGVTANRNRKASERKKAEWAKRHAYARLAADLRALHNVRAGGAEGSRGGEAGGAGGSEGAERAAASLRATRVSQD